MDIKTLVADNYFEYAHSRYEGQPWENPDHWSFSTSLVGNVKTPTMVWLVPMIENASIRSETTLSLFKLRKIETVYVEIPALLIFLIDQVNLFQN